MARGISRSGWKDVLICTVIAAAIVLIWYVFWLELDRRLVSTAGHALSSEELRALFGDKFGAVNSLFSGLAFAGIIASIIFQNRELRHQRDEIERNRRTVEERNAAAEKERFETTFFRLLTVHAEITSRLETRAGVNGRAAHEYFIDQFASKDREFSVYRALQKLTRDQIRAIEMTGDVSLEAYPQLSAADVSSIQDALEKLPQAFASYLDQNKPHHITKVKAAYELAAADQLDYFAHYFRNLYHILKYLQDATALEEGEKKLYARLLRAQLSDAELVSIFYNSFCHYDVPGRAMELGHPKMKKLLKHFDVLQHMSDRQLIHRIHLEIFDEDRV